MTGVLGDPLEAVANKTENEAKQEKRKISQEINACGSRTVVHVGTTMVVLHGSDMDPNTPNGLLEAFEEIDDDMARLEAISLNERKAEALAKLSEKIKLILTPEQMDMLDLRMKTAFSTGTPSAPASSGELERLQKKVQEQEAAIVAHEKTIGELESEVKKSSKALAEAQQNGPSLPGFFRK